MKAFSQLIAPLSRYVKVDQNHPGFLLSMPAETEQNILVIVLWTGGEKR